MQNTRVSLPEQLGRLRRISRIGAGGFATVWLYHDDELRSSVAVKALADNWAQRDDIRKRFLEEARILRQADSDHVVRVYDIGEVDGTPYFVMSYADRGSLADHLAPDQPLPPPMVVDVISQAALGVDVLHRHGVIHRDIKPQNLLLHGSPDGYARVLVADLGVAKAALHATGVTQVVGTPAYMAPEQSVGVHVDRRADVHALAAVAYQMFTGHRVRDGMDAVAKGEPPIPPTRFVALPPAADGVLLKALNADPDRRFGSVLDFTQALQASVLGSTPSTSLPGRPPTPAPMSPPPMSPDGTSTISPTVRTPATVPPSSPQPSITTEQGQASAVADTGMPTPRTPTPGTPVPPRTGPSARTTKIVMIVSAIVVLAAIAAFIVINALT